MVGGLPASVWRHALRFVDNKSLAQNVCRVSRIFQRYRRAHPWPTRQLCNTLWVPSVSLAAFHVFTDRLGMRVLRERERHSRTEREKQRAAAAAKNANDPGLFSSGHFADGDGDEE